MQFTKSKSTQSQNNSLLIVKQYLFTDLTTDPLKLYYKNIHMCKDKHNVQPTGSLVRLTTTIP